MKNILLAIILSLFAMGCASVGTVQRESLKSSSFSGAQIDLIMAADSATPMRVYTISNKEDSLLLRTESENVVAHPDDPVLRNFIKRLYATVTDSISLGVGIAAPQVGILKNVIWVQRFDKEDSPFEVYLNPRIIQYTEKKQERAEGCLSVPNRRETLKTRSYAILLEYDQLDKSHKFEMVEDFTAVIFQHEIDHLNGILYFDHLEDELMEAEVEAKGTRK